MNTLLILGSKPEPALPSPSSYQDVACANASGHSAFAHDLPRPIFTAMTPIIATRIEAGRQSLQAIAGLSTGTLYFLRERRHGKRGIEGLVHQIKTLKAKPPHRMQPFFLKRMLRTVDYRHDDLVAIAAEEYDTLVERLCDHDDAVCTQLRRKRPSTGIIALALAMDRHQYQRYILSGFSFELTHSYGHNPVIEKRGTTASSHAETDVMVLRYLARKNGNLLTTERSVHERAAVPLVPGEIR